QVRALKIDNPRHLKHHNARACCCQCGRQRSRPTAVKVGNFQHCTTMTTGSVQAKVAAMFTRAEPGFISFKKFCRDTLVPTIATLTFHRQPADLTVSFADTIKKYRFAAL